MTPRESTVRLYLANALILIGASQLFWVGMQAIGLAPLHGSTFDLVALSLTSFALFRLNWAVRFVRNDKLTERIVMGGILIGAIAIPNGAEVSFIHILLAVNSVILIFGYAGIDDEPRETAVEETDRSENGAEPEGKETWRAEFDRAIQIRERINVLIEVVFWVVIGTMIAPLVIHEPWTANLMMWVVPVGLVGVYVLYRALRAWDNKAWLLLQGQVETELSQSGRRKP